MKVPTEIQNVSNKSFYMKILKYSYVLLTFIIPSLSIADFPICAGDTYLQTNPTVVCGDTNYFVIWTDGRGANPTNIYGQFVSPTGTLVDTNFFIGPDAGSQGNPALAYDGTNYLLVWEENILFDTFIYAQLVSFDGIPIGNSFPICTTSAMEPTVCWNGTNYLIVWSDFRDNLLESDIYGQIVSPNGTLIDTNFAISTAPDAQGFPCTASDEVNYLVVWTDMRNIDTSSRDIYGQLISSAGALIDTNSAISTAPKGQDFPIVIWNGVNYLVVWLDARNWPSIDVRGQFISAEGNLVDSDFVIISKNSRPSIAWDGVNYLFVWVEGRVDTSDIYGQFVSGAGSPIDTAFAVCTASNMQCQPVVDCSGGDYLVVWTDRRNGNEDIYGGIIQIPGIEEIVQNIKDKVKEPRAMPNPFINYTKIIGIPNEEIEIYDLCGRMVQRIIKGYTWNGVDKNGEKSSPGIYFLKAKDYQVIKVVKLR